MVDGAQGSASSESGAQQPTPPGRQTPTVALVPLFLAQLKHSGEAALTPVLSESHRRNRFLPATEGNLQSLVGRHGLTRGNTARSLTD